MTQIFLHLIIDIRPRFLKPDLYDIIADAVQKKVVCLLRKKRSSCYCQKLLKLPNFRFFPLNSVSSFVLFMFLAWECLNLGNGVSGYT